MVEDMQLIIMWIIKHYKYIHYASYLLASQKLHAFESLSLIGCLGV